MIESNVQKKLVKILFERSFCYDPEGGFVLSSGQRSNVYIDVKKTVYSPEGMELVGRVFFERIKAEPIDGIGGITLGADPIAYAAALISNLEGKPLEVFVVRKDAKKHGTQRWIEGNLNEGAKVVIVDDVVTTGASTVKAIDKAREAGFEVIKVIALVDREEGGREAIEKLCNMEAIVAKKDLLRLYEEKTGQKRKSSEGQDPALKIK
jgi:orotate phosphoribosyltransferase